MTLPMPNDPKLINFLSFLFAFHRCFSLDVRCQAFFTVWSLFCKFLSTSWLVSSFSFAVFNLLWFGHQITKLVYKINSKALLTLLTICKIHGVCHFLSGSSDFFSPSLSPASSVLVFFFWVEWDWRTDLQKGGVLSSTCPRPLTQATVSQAASQSQLKMIKWRGWRVQRITCLSPYFA